MKRIHWSVRKGPFCHVWPSRGWHAVYVCTRLARTPTGLHRVGLAPFGGNGKRNEPSRWKSLGDRQMTLRAHWQPKQSTARLLEILKNGKVLEYMKDIFGTTMHSQFSPNGKIKFLSFYLLPSARDSATFQIKLALKSISAPFLSKVLNVCCWKSAMQKEKK